MTLETQTKEVMTQGANWGNCFFHYTSTVITYTCCDCQLVNPPQKVITTNVLLRHLPVIKSPLKKNWFETLLVIKSAQGHCFLLVLVDYTTQYLETVSLQNISACSLVQALLQNLQC